ncbi:MAG TPA: YdeI/OmpD-associated family protein [Vicinamibacteria bacterium]|nr:YdeI/OmpD-associated family protein [Vicinamibacteria bacterium]
MVDVDPRQVKTFKDEAAFEKWLAAHHDSAPEVWIKVHKKSSGLASVTTAEALDVALCWGWIDGLRKSFDERSFLQRYSRRGRKSTWSQINRDHVARLVAAGRMTPHGQAQVDAARADGRWDAAYAPLRTISVASLPDDLLAAIEANPRARRMLGTLNKPNLFSLAFRTTAAKTPTARAKRVAAFVGMLARGKTLVPNVRSPDRYKASRPPARRVRSRSRSGPRRRRS